MMSAAPASAQTLLSVSASGSQRPLSVSLTRSLDSRCASGDGLLRDPDGVPVQRQRWVHDDVQPMQTLGATPADEARGGELGLRHRLGEVGEVRALRGVLVEGAARLCERPEGAQERGVAHVQPARPFEARGLVDGTVYRGHRLVGQRV